MISSVGIDLSRTGRHQVCCLDEQARPCDSFSFRCTLEGLAALEERIFQNGANPTIVFEPTSLAWIPMAVYLRVRHTDCRLVKARLQKVAALRRCIRSRTKSDRVDGLTLAKMPFIDAEQLDEAYPAGRIPCPSVVNPSTGAPSEEHHCPQEPNRLHH